MPAQLNRLASLRQHKQLRVEDLEDRRMLAIVWANPDPAANGFDSEYGAQADLATAIVQRAIGDWERAITSFNYDVDNDANPSNDLNDTFTLTLGAGDIAGRGVTSSVTYGADLRPYAATVTLDDNADGDGWYFDATPLDDAEFAAATGPYEASFTDASTAGQTAVYDFYRTALHEIGHAVGIGLIDVTALDSGQYPYLDANGGPLTNPNATNTSDPVLGTLTPRGVDQEDSFRLVSDPDGTPGTGDEVFAVNELWEYALAGGGTITFTEAGGGHFYDGAPDPNHSGIEVHDAELMAAGFAAPGATAAVVRQYISDTATSFLADAFGYTTASPAGSQDIAAQDFTAGLGQISFETHGGTLLVQGLHWDPTAATAVHVDDTISITQVGGEVRAAISYTLDNGDSYSFTRDIDAARVQQIIVAGSGGTDSVTVAGGLASITHQVDYVVSSNEDLDDPGTLGDGVVDLDATAPGAQLGLRAAVRDANAAGAASAIYVAPNPGRHVLSRVGTEANNAAYNDLDIDEDIAIYGAGAGASVVDAAGISDRVFTVRGGADLLLSRLTVTGGAASGGGGGLLVETGGAATLDQVAVVGNSAGGSGGGLLALSYPGTSGLTDVTIDRSVFYGNSTTQHGGGVYASQSGTTLTVGDSVFVGNTASLGSANVGQFNGAVGVNNGDNLVGAYSGSLFSSGAGDVVNGAPDEVVTSIVDTAQSGGSADALSLREAIDLANTASGADEVWLPAWDLRLSIQRTDQPTDLDALYGDLDVLGDLTLRRAGSVAGAVGWADSTVTDKVFELVGDYNNDLHVTASDYSVWYSQNGSSGVDPDAWENLPGDGDDDDDVDSADYYVWRGNLGADLTLIGVS
ncbi:hypothetical protein KOR34_43570 [Posidoniimonas corsicana]|uniref:Uncharacterized protein n=1 Tax=Posidoniimonas corsicana TaxID=1938618 RepID=A0A5C5UX74_9BACT|nr:hypothetical protein [Posidoniimonas corsicana]TWT30984.1 hypothetical protein KOR34_43570 [Posidoniimonas corsicana]